MSLRTSNLPPLPLLYSTDFHCFISSMKESTKSSFSAMSCNIRATCLLNEISENSISNYIYVRLPEHSLPIW